MFFLSFLFKQESEKPKKKVDFKKEKNSKRLEKNFFDSDMSSNNQGSYFKGNNNNNKKVIINLFILFISLILLALIIGFGSGVNNRQKNEFSDLLTQLRQGNVSKITLSSNNQNLLVQVYEPLSQEAKQELQKDPSLAQKDPVKYAEKDRNRVRLEIYPNIATGSRSIFEILQELTNKEVRFGNGPGEVIFAKEQKNQYTSLLQDSFFQSLLFLLVMGALGYFMIRKLGETNSKSISFGNSRGKLYDAQNNTKITFRDVAGNEEAKQELAEVVDFLKRSEEYAKMGAKIPKGILLVGSPGNGKTLMAKAVAGEASVPFIYVSGSEFVEMFVGVGASRVRDLFKQAKKRAPCLIFIDEIDAVGRQRGIGMGGGNDEREQTLNQILVEMDGFEATDSVIVIGATNRPDVLDPALLRPGRFDRQITVTMPDRAEREKILRIHAKNKKLAKDVDLGLIAKRTAGFSGADLMNVLNEAAILAVREKSEFITDLHAREAIEKVLLGPSLRSKVITEEQKKLTAYHEAGHALIQTIIPEARKVQKITIIPRGRAAGYTFADDGENDKNIRKRSEFLADITVSFGGYVAEEIIFGEVSTGASNDLQKATESARNMVTKYGMSSLGPISFSEVQSLNYIGRESEQKIYSESTAELVDKEVAKILQECYQKCKKIISQNLEDLHKIASSLIEKEVIEHEEFTQLVSHLLPKQAS